MKRRALAILLAGCWLAAAAASPAVAQSDAGAEKAIRDALSRWTDDFNARDATRSATSSRRTCATIFADLRNATTMPCAALLHRALGDRSKTLTYSFDIKEIIVSGDMAIVRLVWTSKVSQRGLLAGDRDQGARTGRVPSPA